MIHFSIFGIPVAVQPFFWVTMALLGGALNANSPEALLKLALFILAGFISILVHELGHALTIKHYKLPTSITLQAFGGYATYPSGRLTRPQNFLVTAGGPAAQLVLALVAHVIIERFKFDMNPNILSFLGALRWVSILWAVLNLLPVLPMDGGQLVNAVLGPARIRITLWISIITGVVIGVLAALGGMIFLAVLLGVFAFQAGQALRDTRWR